MSDDGNRHDHLPTEGEPNFSENGSETMENDQPGLPSWAAALTAQVTAQLQATFEAPCEAQLTQMSEAQAGRDAANQAELRTALEECSIAFLSQSHYRSVGFFLIFLRSDSLE